MADSKIFKILDSAIKHLSDLIKLKMGLDVSNLPGAVTAVSLGAGATGFVNADWIITGEGKFDILSPLSAKVISGIAKLAQQTNTKVMVIADDVKLDRSVYSSFRIIDEIWQSYSKTIISGGLKLSYYNIKIGPIVGHHQCFSSIDSMPQRLLSLSDNLCWAFCH